MSATFEPREVEPKALRRWALLALQLLRRGPLPALVSAGVFLGLAAMASRSWVAMSLVGMWCCVHFQMFANRADRETVRLADVPTHLGASLFEMLQHFKRSPAVSVGNFAGVCVYPLLLGFNPLFEVDSSRVLRYVDASSLPMDALGPATALGMFMLSGGLGFMLFGYLLVRMTNAGFLQLARLSRLQRKKNGWLGVVFDFTSMFIVMLASQLPLTLVIAAPFIGVWSYVAFRDVYLHQDGNQQRTSSVSLEAFLPASGS